MENEMKRNILKELWRNRPTKFFPEIVKFIKRYPPNKDTDLQMYIRNVLHLNWQVAFKR